MRDLIDRAEAIKALQNCQTYLFDEHDPDKKIELRSAEWAIEDLPSAENWILCDKKLPDVDYVSCMGVQYSEFVLVIVAKHGVVEDIFTDVARIADGRWQLDDGFMLPEWCEIVAWMPFPKAYVKREENDV